MDAPSSTFTDSPSYARLRRDLGDDAHLLNFLPYKRATFELQNEMPEAAPERLLYGDMLESKAQLWIYFTLNSYNKQKQNDSRMLTFQTIEGALNHEAGVRPAQVNKVAIASFPFKHAQGHQVVEAIAKYFFIHKGIDKQLQFPVSSAPFRESLVRACQTYKTLFEKTHANRPASRRSSIMPTGGSHVMGHAKFHGLRESAHAASVARSPAPSPLASFNPSQAQFRAPSRAMSRAESQPMSMSSVDDRKRRHSLSPDHYPGSSQHQDSHTQPGRLNATQDKRDDPLSYSRPPSPFLAAAQSPLHDLADDEDMEDAPLSENNEAELEQSADSEQPASFDRDAMIDQYISLKAREEELDAKISDIEMERTTIADQIAELQANMNAIIDRKEDLEREKARVRAEKKKLQVQLNEDEHLDFGFEAGRRMETKRQRKD